jgi:hypothetical protein
MATVDKNFRIKHGLVVEGATATVNGNAVLTENSGDSYILNLVGGATLVKSVDTDVFNVDGSGYLTINANTFDSYGSASAAEQNANDYTDSAISTEVTNRNSAIATAKSEAISTASSDATTKANAAQTAAQNYADSLASNYDAAGAAASAQAAAESYADNAASAAQSAAESFATSAANTAQSAAQTYADNAASSAQSAAEDYADNAATNAENAAKSYADGLISTEVTNRNNAISNAISTEVTDRDNAISTAITNLNLAGTYDALGAAADALADANTYTDGKVADLVDSAPALLNTLNELAAAIADNPNYASDVANLVATKADTTYVDGEISSLDTAAQGYASTAQSNAQSFATTAANNAQSAAEDYADSLASNYDAAGSAATAQSNAETFATNAANAAQTAAENYADGLASNYDASGSAATAESNANSYTDSAISNGNSSATPSYSAIQLGGYTKQVGNWVAAGTAGVQVTAFEYPTNWGSAEFLVRVMSNTAGHQHSQLSKVLVTTDGAGNVAIMEYGIVTTNGTMGDVTADISNGNIRIRVTPQYASSEVIVSGSLLAYND